VSGTAGIPAVHCGEDVNHRRETLVGPGRRWQAWPNLGAVSDLAEARRLALSLPEVTEEPHFDMASFRVRGKIFVTAPPEETRLHVFVDPLEVDAYVAQDPAAFEPLWWGARVRGLRVDLAATSADGLAEIIEEAWRRKAPKSLIAAYDRQRED
jgi:hypothetical protein